MMRYFLVWILLISVIWAGPVLAFFPSPSSVAREVDERLGVLDTLQVRMTCREFPQWSVLLWIQDGSWRQEWVQGQSDAARVEAAALGQNDRLLAAFPRTGRFPVPLLHLWYDHPLATWWRTWGIDVGAMDYGFVHTTPCLVLGGLQGQAQLWVHTEKHVPVHLTTRSGVQCTWTEYHRVGNHPLPHLATVTMPDGREVHWDLDWRGVNVQLPPDLFAKQDFRQRFARAAADLTFPPELQALWQALPAAR